jgi:hypothetical protein
MILFIIGFIFSIIILTSFWILFNSAEIAEKGIIKSSKTDLKLGFIFIVVVYVLFTGGWYISFKICGWI